MTLTSSPSGAAEARSCIQLSQTLARFGTVSLNADQKPDPVLAGGTQPPATHPQSELMDQKPQFYIFH